jgi:cell division protein FtsZ
MTLFEVDEAANRIKEEVDADANIIFGSSFDENMDGRMRVSVVATGIESERDRAKRAAAAAAQSQAEQAPPPPPVTSGPAPFRFKPTVHKPQPFPAPPAPERRPAAADPRQHQAHALAAPAEASHAGFVAPQPVEPGYQREQAQPVVPGQWGRPRPAEGEPAARVQSLFEKVTLGLTRGRSQRPTVPQPAPQQEAQPRAEPVATAPVERAPAAAAPGGTRTVERVPATAGDDEVYDIPTFLRR